jgi:hypothetical protein
MNGDQALDFVAAITVVSFLGYSLVRQRYPMRVWQVMIPLWTAIIGAVWLTVDVWLKYSPK